MVNASSVMTMAEEIAVRFQRGVIEI